jgi:small subunit ribosomal protein S3
LKEDVKIRDFLFQKLNKMGVGKIEIERASNSVKIVIHTARPGLIIGRGGTGIEQLREQLKRHLSKGSHLLKKKNQELRLEVEEIKQSESHATIIAQSIADQLEKRLPYRRVLKQALQRTTQNKEVLGVKIMIKGRLDGAEIARKEWLAKGRIPLQTLRANIDFGISTAHTTYGTVGVKVWIYKGEVFE